MGGLPRARPRPRSHLRGAAPAGDPVAAEIDDVLANTRSGELTLRFRGGTVRVSTDGTPWCDVVDDAELRSLLDRLATIAEDPRMILALTDAGDFLQESPAKLARRDFQVRRDGDR